MVTENRIEIAEPGISRFLFSDTRASWLWLVLRVYLGWQWAEAGWAKINDPSWLGAQAGTTLHFFVNAALQKTGGAHPDVSFWYARFLENIILPNSVLFSYLVVYSEIIIGLLLIVGAFTGIVAFLSAFLIVNYLFAGALSVNPLFLLIAFFLILAWRNAGWWGFDRILLPGLGVPWNRASSQS